MVRILLYIFLTLIFVVLPATQLHEIVSFLKTTFKIRDIDVIAYMTLFYTLHILVLYLIISGSIIERIKISILAIFINEALYGLLLYGLYLLGFDRPLAKQFDLAQIMILIFAPEISTLALGLHALTEKFSW